MPSLTIILYCFRQHYNASCIIDQLVEYNVRQRYRSKSWFEYLVLCLAPIINDISWDQWITAAIDNKQFPFRRTLDEFRTNGELPVAGNNTPVDIRVAQKIILGATNAEWAWALGMPEEKIEHYSIRHDAQIIDIIRDVELTERIINRAFVRLGRRPIPFPVPLSDKTSIIKPPMQQVTKQVRTICKIEADILLHLTRNQDEEKISNAFQIPEQSRWDMFHRLGSMREDKANIALQYLGLPLININDKFVNLYQFTSMMKKYSSRWFEIGHHLGIDYNYRNSIIMGSKSDTGNLEDILYRFLQSNSPSWGNIAYISKRWGWLLPILSSPVEFTLKLMDKQAYNYAEYMYRYPESKQIFLQRYSAIQYKSIQDINVKMEKILMDRREAGLPIAIDIV